MMCCGSCSTFHFQCPVRTPVTTLLPSVGALCAGVPCRCSIPLDLSPARLEAGFVRPGSRVGTVDAVILSLLVFLHFLLGCSPAARSPVSHRFMCFKSATQTYSTRKHANIDGGDLQGHSCPVEIRSSRRSLHWLVLEKHNATMNSVLTPFHHDISPLYHQRFSEAC
jgi:hypothetical protein